MKYFVSSYKFTDPFFVDLLCTPDYKVLSLYRAKSLTKYAVEKAKVINYCECTDNLIITHKDVRSRT